MVRYDIVCLHTIVGYAPAHAAHFSVKANGVIQQSRDTRYQSAANLNGNHRVIAIENEDHGPAFGSWNVNDGHAVPDFTPAQIEANAKILAWAHETHGIPLQLCPNSRSSSRGLAYHRQGIDGNWADYRYSGRVTGGEIWTSSRGKVCPGDRRISRRQQILARAIQIANGDDDMPGPSDWTAADWAEFDEHVWNKINTRAKFDVERMLREIWESGGQDFPNLFQGDRAISPHSAAQYTHQDAANLAEQLTGDVVGRATPTETHPDTTIPSALSWVLRIDFNLVRSLLPLVAELQLAQVEAEVTGAPLTPERYAELATPIRDLLDRFNPKTARLDPPDDPIVPLDAEE